MPTRCRQDTDKVPTCRHVVGMMSGCYRYVRFINKAITFNIPARYKYVSGCRDVFHLFTANFSSFGLFFDNLIGALEKY